MGVLRIDRSGGALASARPRARPARTVLAVGAAVFVIAFALLALRSGHPGAADRLSGRAAERAAVANPAVHAYLSRAGYTRTRSISLDDELMRVSFFNRSRIVLD